MQYDNNFFDERDLLDCLNRGYEIEFLYNNKRYSITHTDEGVSIIEYNNPESERCYADAFDALNHEFGKKI